MPLHIDYRPDDFDEVIGNEGTVKSLKAVLKRKSPPHVFLFTGPSGCGKTTLGRIVKKYLKCDNADYKELDMSENGGIDIVRDIRRHMGMRPMAGETRVYLLDEVHGMSPKAKEAMLKALEDTPSHVYFILCTTEPQKLTKTIQTRCTPFSVKPLTSRHIDKLLEWVLEEEEAEVSKEALKQIKECCDGSARLALVLLEKVIGLNPEEQADAVEAAVAEEQALSALFGAYLRAKNWKQLAPTVKAITDEPENVRRYLLGCCNGTLLKGNNKKAYLLMNALSEPTYDMGKAKITMALYEAINEIG